MQRITRNLMDTFLPVVFVLNTISAHGRAWNLVSAVDCEMASCVNYISHVLVRTFLALGFSITSRIVLVKMDCEEDHFSFLATVTDIAAFLTSHLFPSNLILATVVLISYAVVGFRFIYDVIVTGHGLNWLFCQIRNFIQTYEEVEQRSKSKTYQQSVSHSDSNIAHLYRKL